MPKGTGQGEPKRDRVELGGPEAVVGEVMEKQNEIKDIQGLQILQSDKELAERYAEYRAKDCDHDDAITIAQDIIKQRR